MSGKRGNSHGERILISTIRIPGRERGAALLLALLATALLGALGIGLLVVGDEEARIAVNYRTGMELFYAADAGAHLAISSLRTTARWTDALTGAAASSFHDATHAPVMANRQMLDLDAITTELQAESNSAGVWGADNPVWRLYVWGPLAAAVPSAPSSSAYLSVWIADDGADGDGKPAQDANHIVRLHAEAYASLETRRIVEVTIMQSGGAVRVLAWREVR